MRTERQRRPLAERFWEKVDKDGPIPPHRPELGQCWVWTGCRNRTGYGQIQIGTRGEGLALSHRVSWLLASGAPPEDLFVCHHCDNPACVRPEHLFLGTQENNMRDAAQKHRVKTPGLRGDQHPLRLNPERVARGERQGSSKLTDARVSEMRRLRADGVPARQLAEMFGVALPTVNGIIARRSWRHVA